jgi:lipoprotein-anchoring transpeptidase ErfK/SrfK
MALLRRLLIGLSIMAGAALVIIVAGVLVVFFSTRSIPVAAPITVASPITVAAPPQVAIPIEKVELLLTNPIPSRRYVEDALAALGLPVGTADGKWDEKTQRAVCAWRELTYGESSRAMPSDLEARQIVSTKVLTPALNQVVGLNVNIACQTATWVSAARTILGVFPVSSGMPGYLSTSVGTWQVGWQVNHWYESTLYPEAMMYRPKFFHRGMAIHGSATDALVLPYPASHGCVRMLHADLDRLWDAGFGIGDTVNVYGEWISDTQ